MATKTTLTFRNLLKRHRVAKGLSFGSLARRARLHGKISPSHIVRLEQGDRKPSREKVLLLAKALELSPVDTERFFKSAGQLPVAQEENLTSVLDNPAISAILRILEDPKLHPQRKLRAQESVVSYVTWLHSELLSDATRGSSPARHRRSRSSI